MVIIRIEKWDYHPAYPGAWRLGFNVGWMWDDVGRQFCRCNNQLWHRDSWSPCHRCAKQCVCVCVQYDHHQIVFWLVVLTSFNHLEHMSSIEFVNGMELSHILWNIKAMFET